MNKVYKSVWNESIGAWVAVSETAAARGKRNGRLTKAVVASVVTLGAAGSAVAGATDGGTVESATGVAVGPNAQSQDTGTIAIGMNSYTDGVIGSTPPPGVISGTIAVGYNARSVGPGSIAIGQNSAIGDATSLAVTNAVALGYAAVSNGQQAVSIGASASAVAASSVALGSGAVADRTNTVSIGSSTTQRQLVQVARGTQATDAVNVGQITPLVSALGGGAALNEDGSISGPTFTVAGKSFNNVNDALEAAGAGSKYLSANDAATNSNGASAIGIGSIAIGGNAVADSTGGSNAALAIGSDSRASTKATALGPGATASALDTVALGTLSVADRQGTVSVGNATTKRQIVNVAAGTQAYDGVNVTQLQNVTTLLGGGAKVNADGTIQAPAYTVAGASFGTVGDAITKVDTELSNKVAYDAADQAHITLGGAGTSKLVTISNLQIGDLSSTSTDAINGSQLYSTNQRVGSLETFEGNINNGGGIKYFHTNSTLADSSATGTDSVAIGGAAVASANNSVALGSNSVADRVNSVSVGAAGKERQITNVEAGTASTDAVNVGQLTAVSNNVDTLGSLAVKYDTNTDGTPNYGQITLGGAGATKPTLLTNVASGKLTDDSTDAVNGSQLYATNQNVAALQDFTNNVNNGGGIKYFHSNSTLADSSATGADSVAIGGAAVSSGKNSVALGSNSVADRDNTVSVGAAGSERQVTNVAAGTASTDAVNVGQLNAVSNSVTSLGASAIKYDTNADGTPDYANATLGNGNATGTALHNVAAGTGNMDAVNLGQLNDMMGQVTNLANGAYNPLFTADGNRDTEIATSSGTHSVASGANAMASGANSVASGATSVASGTNSIAVGSNTSATANNAVAVGANASATANNSVALGAGSVADRANAVSVGTTAAGGQRQVTNVAAGTDGTDAVNVNQMQQSVNTGVKSAKGYTDALRSDMDSGLSLANNHINSVGAMSSAMAMMAGSAAAVADKDNRFAPGTGVYRNKAAIAIGFQKRFGTNMVITVGGSTTGEESTGGAGFAFGF
ncbi:ESPR-type extended signal peptide-containing protein [Caballeronia sp. LjRoot29]|uniref:ESPR-type extended signal peptide-containing protein n=1 Tax=Caballeronia sp. LjRoot29 TaxID=3342315 RepID=UPI003ECEDE19